MTYQTFTTALLLLILAGAAARAGEKEFAALHGQGNEAYRKADYGKAVSLYQRALAEKDDPHVAYNLGNALFQLGRKKEAAAAWRRALKKQPVFPEASANLGMALYELGEHRAALEALAGAGSTLAAWRVRAACFQKLGDLGAALFALRQSAALAPDDLALRAAEGQLLYRLKRYREAVQAFAFVTARTPTAADAWTLMGWSLVGLDQKEEALEALEIAIRLDPRPDRATLRILGDLYAAAGLSGQAAALLERSWTGTSPSGSQVLAAAGLYRKAGRGDDALRLANRVLKSRAGAVEALVLKGELLLAAGEVDGARSAFAGATAAKDSALAARAHVGLGACHIRRALEEKALASFRAALRLDPRLGPAHVGRGRLRFLRGEYGKALEDFRRALEINPADRRAARFFDLTRRILLEDDGE